MWNDDDDDDEQGKTKPAEQRAKSKKIKLAKKSKEEMANGQNYSMINGVVSRCDLGFNCAKERNWMPEMPLVAHKRIVT